MFLLCKQYLYKMNLKYIEVESLKSILDIVMNNMWRQICLIRHCLRIVFIRNLNVTYLRVWKSFGWLSRFEVPLTHLKTCLFAGYRTSQIDSIMFGGVNLKFRPQKDTTDPINQLNISSTNITWSIGVKKGIKSQAGWAGGSPEPSKSALVRL